jgi:hypothetical protein
MAAMAASPCRRDMCRGGSLAVSWCSGFTSVSLWGS